MTCHDGSPDVTSEEDTIPLCPGARYIAPKEEEPGEDLEEDPR